MGVPIEEMRVVRGICLLTAALKPRGDDEARHPPEGMAGFEVTTSEAGQNAASSRSISERSVASAIARSAVIFGRLYWAKNAAAAILPS